MSQLYLVLNTSVWMGRASSSCEIRVHIQTPAMIPQGVSLISASMETQTPHCLLVA